MFKNKKTKSNRDKHAKFIILSKYEKSITMAKMTSVGNPIADVIRDIENNNENWILKPTLLGMRLSNKIDSITFDFNSDGKAIYESEWMTMEESQILLYAAQYYQSIRIEKEAIESMEKHKSELSKLYGVQK